MRRGNCTVARGNRIGKFRDENSDEIRPEQEGADCGAYSKLRSPGKMEKGVLKYGEYDGEQSEPIRVDRDRESQTRVKKHAEKAEKNRVSTLGAMDTNTTYSPILDSATRQRLRNR